MRGQLATAVATLPRQAVRVWAALVLLLAAAILLSFLPLGQARPWLVLAAALLQAGIILWWSMEAGRLAGPARIFALVGFVFVMVFLALGLSDYLTRTGPLSYPAERPRGFSDDPG